MEYVPARTSDHGSVHHAESWRVLRVFDDGSSEVVRTFALEDHARRTAEMMNR